MSGRSLSEEAKYILRSGLEVARAKRSSNAADFYEQFRARFAGALLTGEEHGEMMTVGDDWKRESVTGERKATE